MAAWIKPAAEAMKRLQGEQIWHFDHANMAAGLKGVGELIGA